jgi:hypothetical protein
MTTISCKIVKNKGIVRVESGVKSLLARRSATQKSIKSTIFKGLTIKSIPDRIRVLLTKNGGLQYVI